MFFQAKMTGEKMQMMTVKPTCGPQRGLELYINQPECSPSERGRCACKKEEKRTVSW